jgi:hypothetical protein
VLKFQPRRAKHNYRRDRRCRSSNSGRLMTLLDLCSADFRRFLTVEFKEMAQDPLVRREPVSASCHRRSDEGLETQKHIIYPKEHPANCPLRWRLINGLGVYLS